MLKILRLFALLAALAGSAWGIFELSRPAYDGQSGIAYGTAPALLPLVP